MRKYVLFNGLDARPASPRRAAFTLAELVVALGILLLMLSLAGQVFNLTIQSTGQATALTRISQQLRALERTLREDLADVQPGESLIVIQGNPVNAYWTAQGQEADPDRTSASGGPKNGYPHAADPEREVTLPTGTVTDPVPVLPRADMLMFFTNRTASSYVDPKVTSNVQQVVYGHAELGDYTAKATSSREPTCDDALPESRNGAYQFNGLRAGAATKLVFPVDDKGYPSPTALCEVPAAEWHLARRSVLLMPTPPATLTNPYVLSWPVDAAAHVGSRNHLGRLDDPWLLNGSTDVLWDFNYDNAVLKPRPRAGPLVPVLPPINDCWQQPAAISDAMGVVGIPRSNLDPSPPALCASRLGHYLLPNCASFKVEWSLNPRSDFVAGRLDGGNEILWFDPGLLEDQTKPTSSKDDPLDSLTKAVESLSARIKVESNRQKKDALEAQHAALKNLLEVETPHSDTMMYSLAARFGIPPSAPTNCAINNRLAVDKRANLILFAANRRVQDPGTPPGTNPPPPTYVPDDVFPGALKVTVDVYDPERRLERPIRHVMVIPVGRS